jgi:hypothetical protein
MVVVVLCCGPRKPEQHKASGFCMNKAFTYPQNCKGSVYRNESKAAGSIARIRDEHVSFWRALLSSSSAGNSKSSPAPAVSWWKPDHDVSMLPCKLWQRMCSLQSCPLVPRSGTGQAKGA